MDPGWLILCVALAIECFLVTLLIMPVPSNMVRGAITQWIVSLLSNQTVKYSGFAILVLDAYYFAYTMDAISNPLVHVGILSPLEESIVSCETGLAMFRNERNAYITGFSLFMFLVLRRLVDIQSQLFESRRVAKASTQVPVGRPVESGKPKNA